MRWQYWNCAPVLHFKHFEWRLAGRNWWIATVNMVFNAYSMIIAWLEVMAIQCPLEIDLNDSKARFLVCRAFAANWNYIQSKECGSCKCELESNFEGFDFNDEIKFYWNFDAGSLPMSLPWGELKNVLSFYHFTIDLFQKIVRSLNSKNQSQGWGE